MSVFFRLVQGNEAATNSVEVCLSISTPSISVLAMIATPTWASFSQSFLATNLNSGGRISLSVMPGFRCEDNVRFCIFQRAPECFFFGLYTLKVDVENSEASLGCSLTIAWVGR